MAGSPPRQAVRIQSLARANGILEAVAAAPKGSASLTEISQALGLNKTTATYRYDRAHGTFTPVTDHSGLEALGIAYFQTASELFKAHHYE